MTFLLHSANEGLYLSPLEFEAGRQFEPITEEGTLGKNPKRAQREVEKYPELERTRLVVIKQDLAIVSTLGQMKLEDMLASQSDMTPKFLPAVDADYKGLLQGLADKVLSVLVFGILINLPCSIAPSV